MFSIRGRGTTLCDGLSRRELLRVGGLSLFTGLTLPRRSRALTRQGKARSIILFNLLGGPSHQDMVDLKPDAPPEIRGEFKPISTSVPGIQICEHLPNLARWMRGRLIRTFTHNFNSHDPFPFMTGYTDQNFLAQAGPSDPPDVGAVCQYLGLGPRDVPGAVCMPCYPGWGEGRQAARSLWGLPRQPVRSILHALPADLWPRAESELLRSCVAHGRAAAAVL